LTGNRNKYGSYQLCSFSNKHSD